MNRAAPLLVTVGLLTATACSGRPPAPPGRDAAVTPVDAGPSIDGSLVPVGRPDGGPRLPSADREIVLPYFGDSEEEVMEVEGDVGTLDVFFSIDTTGSFGGEIDNLQAELRTAIVPSLRSRVDDVAIGVGRFEDFPSSPFGEPTDRPFRLLAAVTSDQSRVNNAVASLDQPLGNGADVPEAGAEALYQIATGAGYGSLIPEFRGPAATGGGLLGGVGYRQDALRVLVHVTDAPTHEPGDYGSVYPDTHSLGDATNALAELGVRALGIASGEQARPNLEALAVGTGAVADPVGGQCHTGIAGASRAPRGGVCPLVFDVRSDGSGLATAIVDAITDLLATVSYDEVWGETDDRLGFVRAIEAFEATPPSGTPEPARADLRPSDGIDDTFLAASPGTRLRFRAILRNETIPPADYDQIYNLTLRVVGDGVTLLTRRLRVTVPRGRLDAGAPSMDAGSTDAGSIDGGSDGGAPDAGGPDAG